MNYRRGDFCCRPYALTTCVRYGRANTHASLTYWRTTTRNGRNNRSRRESCSFNGLISDQWRGPSVVRRRVQSEQKAQLSTLRPFLINTRHLPKRLYLLPLTCVCVFSRLWTDTMNSRVHNTNARTHACTCVLWRISECHACLCACSLCARPDVVTRI